jgi:hypothetical protein
MKWLRSAQTVSKRLARSLAISKALGDFAKQGGYHQPWTLVSSATERGGVERSRIMKKNRVSGSSCCFDVVMPESLRTLKSEDQMSMRISG